MYKYYTTLLKQAGIQEYLGKNIKGALLIYANWKSELRMKFPLKQSFLDFCEGNTLWSHKTLCHLQSNFILTISRYTIRELERLQGKHTCICVLALIDGGTMSGVRAAGGSLPACFCWINHMANANCSGFNFPSWLMSQRFLKMCKSSCQFLLLSLFYSAAVCHKKEHSWRT